MKRIIFFLFLYTIRLIALGQDQSQVSTDFYQEEEVLETWGVPFSYSDLPQLYQQEQQKEKFIEHLIRVYNLSKDTEKPLILSQLKEQLFLVLDLKIQQTELKIQQLRKDLLQIQKDSVYQEKNEEIQPLKEAISHVEDILQFRKAHRVAIVLNRLKDLGLGFSGKEQN